MRPIAAIEVPESLTDRLPPCSDAQIGPVKNSMMEITDRSDYGSPLTRTAPLVTVIGLRFDQLVGLPEPK